MSVCRMAAMMPLRISLYTCPSFVGNTLQSGRCTMRKRVAQCIISKGDESLYFTARSCEVSTRNWLFTPKCPASCPIAAIISEYWKSSVRKSSTLLISLIQRATVHSTSMPWEKLWYGFGTYAASTAATNFSRQESSTWLSTLAITCAATAALISELQLRTLKESVSSEDSISSGMRLADGVRISTIWLLRFSLLTSRSLSVFERRVVRLLPA
mmetsp:Transcript_74337/g.193885  ORF Transcript_74337/g.193885 Transcript_74337/m.193885 type:complete len:213 (-) Transcript_74337:474-1112(-)